MKINRYDERFTFDIAVTRHICCHSEIINFNGLENIATHDDKGQRRNLCHFLNKTTQPVSISTINILVVYIVIT